MASISGCVSRLSLTARWTGEHCHAGELGVAEFDKDEFPWRTFYHKSVKRGVSWRDWPTEVRFPHEDDSPDAAVDKDTKKNPRWGPNNGFPSLKHRELYAMAVALHTGSLRPVKDARFDDVLVDRKGVSRRHQHCKAANGDCISQTRGITRFSSKMWPRSLTRRWSAGGAFL